MANGDRLMTRREFLMALGGVALIGIGGYPLIRNFLPAISTPMVIPEHPTVQWNGSVKTFF